MRYYGVDIDIYMSLRISAPVTPYTAQAAILADEASVTRTDDRATKPRPRSGNSGRGSIGGSRQMFRCSTAPHVTATGIT
ncbi:hypothetical protein GDO78_022248 [Eleutherodactylus coqui]|uniref:Uncharacterized protein n=1 Tax=Eleutherodactylus coqui TaxID=57060 RepID=A0A8J6EGR7_ELECQ|nr:hypothetical protein GDO78_022248 [Eleutherodactylus coqui]